jgi:hypothetical protein
VKTKRSVAKIIIFILIVLNLISFLFLFVLFYQSAQFDNITCSKLEVVQTINYFKTPFTVSPSKKQQANDVFNLYGKTVKIIVKNINSYGKAIPLFSVVILSTQMPLNIYAKVLAHELEHLKFNFIEYQVEYNAIITLWESTLPYFKYQAYLAAKTVLEGRLDKNYNCSNLLVTYAKKHSS